MPSVVVKVDVTRVLVETECDVVVVVVAGRVVVVEADVVVVVVVEVTVVVVVNVTVLVAVETAVVIPGLTSKLVQVHGVWNWGGSSGSMLPGVQVALQLAHHSFFS